MPASTSPRVPLVSTDFTSTSSVTGLTVTPALANTSAATLPHGTCGWQSATLTPLRARSFTEVILPGLAGGTAISMLLVAKSFGSLASPEVTSESMLAGLAEAKTPAGAPCWICCASPELGPKLNATLTPGCDFSNCLPRAVNDPVSEAAANTVNLIFFFAPVPPPPQHAARPARHKTTATSTARARVG